MFSTLQGVFLAGFTKKDSDAVAAWFQASWWVTSRKLCLQNPLVMPRLRVVSPLSDRSLETRSSCWCQGVEPGFPVSHCSTPLLAASLGEALYSDYQAPQVKLDFCIRFICVIWLQLLLMMSLLQLKCFDSSRWTSSSRGRRQAVGRRKPCPAAVAVSRRQAPPARQ